MEEQAVPCDTLWMMIIPTLDVTSDWLIVVRSVITGQLGTQNILFLVGLGLFLTSQLIRIIMEVHALDVSFPFRPYIPVSASLFKILQRLKEESRPKSDFWVVGGVCGCCYSIPLAIILVAAILDFILLGVYVVLFIVFGACVVAERAIRLALWPLDPFLACGFYNARKEYVMVVRDKFFFLTQSEKEFFMSQPWFMRYYHMWCSLVNGGRWNAGVFCEWDVQHGRNNVELARTICMYALAEEAAENIGGILMAAANLHDNNGQTSLADCAISITSLTISCISILTETGYLIGLIVTHDEH